MHDLLYSEMQGILNQKKEVIARLPTLTMSVLRNITIEPLVPYLRYLAYEIGYNASVTLGGYDNVYQEAVGGQGGLFDDTTDCVLVFLRLEQLSWDLARNYPALDAVGIRAEIERLEDHANRVLDGIRKQTAGMILWHGFEVPVNPALGIWDSQSAGGQSATVTELNGILRQCLGKQTNAYFVDLNLTLARIGWQRFYDPRYWHISRAPFTREALCEIASEDYKFIRALKGKNKKCLVLDCDNTLWGGIVGEDGLAGIELGKTYPGSAHFEFQQEVLNLYHRGVILALCSKNNEADVWQVFREHPDMVLREEHIATAQINWQDKATSLRQIALDLNIGLDSLVLADDSEFEINLVQQVLPEVTTLHLPAGNAISHRERLASCGWFDTLTLTDEDGKRGKMYRAEATRKKLLAGSTDLESYYQSLEMVLEIRLADEFSIPRIAQLTRKTNQFNLTTKRYTETDIAALATSPDADVISLRLGDRFGDLGIVGVCILRYDAARAMFDTFLLSCRALGRCAEDVLIAHCLMLSQSRGMRSALGRYLPTRKNGQVKDFYLAHGFRALDHSDEGEETFLLELEGFVPEVPSFFQRIDSSIGEPAEA